MTSKYASKWNVILNHEKEIPAEIFCQVNNIQNSLETGHIQNKRYPARLILSDLDMLVGQIQILVFDELEDAKSLLTKMTWSPEVTIIRMHMKMDR